MCVIYPGTDMGITHGPLWPKGGAANVSLWVLACHMRIPLSLRYLDSRHCLLCSHSHTSHTQLTRPPSPPIKTSPPDLSHHTHGIHAQHARRPRPRRFPLPTHTRYPTQHLAISQRRSRFCVRWYPQLGRPAPQTIQYEQLFKAV